MTWLRWIKGSVGSALTRSAKRARGTAQRARGVGLAEAVLHGVRRGVVAADLRDNLAVAADHGHRHGVAIGLAGLNRSLRDGHGDGGAQVLVVEELRARRHGRRAGAGRGDCDGRETKP